MKIVIQRCKEASVTVENKIVGQIGSGMTLLVCLEKGDDECSIETAIKKLINMRIFTDEQGKMNLNIAQAQGSFLAISQFTLSWDGRKGNRPSFDLSMPPHEADILFTKFCNELNKYAPVERGVFAADMLVKIENDGPVTFSLNF